ncbi:MAG: hypothetical protein J0M15_11480 [Deltaproteobacteria bacterium]|nr:hypothetical protein [Deltaproteobacteria bacterium]
MDQQIWFINKAIGFSRLKGVSKRDISKKGIHFLSKNDSAQELSRISAPNLVVPLLKGPIYMTGLIKRAFYFFTTGILPFSTFTLLFSIFLLNDLANGKPYSYSQKFQSKEIIDPNLIYNLGLTNYNISSLQKNYLSLSSHLEYDPKESYRIKNYFDYHYELKSQYTSDFSDFYTQLYFSPMPLGNSSTLNSYVIGILPTSKVSQQTLKMFSSIGFAEQYDKQIPVSKGLLKIKANISLLKYFYKQQDGSNGLSNMNWVSNHQISLTMQNQYFGVDLLLKNTLALLYSQQQVTGTNLSEILFWKLNKNARLFFGHSSTSEVLNVNQEEVPIQFYQSELSLFFLGMNYFF